MDLNQTLKTLESLQTEFELNKQELRKVSFNIKKETKKISNLETLRQAIQIISEDSKTELISYIEELVTSCLSATFGDKYEYKIIIDDSRNQQETNFSLKRKDGLSINLREDVCGDSLLDICSLGERISEMILDPESELIALLDEPFRNIREEKKIFVGELLQSLNQELGIQFILIVNDLFYTKIADNIIEV